MYFAAAILAAGVLVSGTLILSPMSRSTTTVTKTSVTTTTVTTTSTSVMTTTVTTSTSVMTLPAGCSTFKSYGYSFGTLVAGAASPAIMCVQVYRFNSTSPFVVNATSLLEIWGVRSGAQLVDAAANFTITASVDKLTLGGPTNANEGAVVAFAITANAGASGTYQLGVQGFHLESQPTMCGPNGDLVAGSGQPSYSPSGGEQLCIIWNTSAGVSFSIPGISYAVPANVLCYRIISLTNSTQ